MQSVFIRIHDGVLQTRMAMVVVARQVEMASSGSQVLLLLTGQKGRTMGAVGQHASSKSNVLSPEVSALAIPWKRVALFATIALGFFYLDSCRCGSRPARQSSSATRLSVRCVWPSSTT